MPRERGKIDCTAALRLPGRPVTKDAYIVPDG